MRTKVMNTHNMHTSKVKRPVLQTLSLQSPPSPEDSIRSFRTVAACLVRLLFKSRKRPVEATCRSHSQEKGMAYACQHRNASCGVQRPKLTKRKSSLALVQLCRDLFGTRGKSASRHNNVWRSFFSIARHALARRLSSDAGTSVL